MTCEAESGPQSYQVYHPHLLSGMVMPMPRAKPFPLADAESTAAGPPLGARDYCCTACRPHVRAPNSPCAKFTPECPGRLQVGVSDCGAHATRCTASGECVCASGYMGDQCDAREPANYNLHVLEGLMVLLAVCVGVVGCRLMCRRSARTVNKAMDQKLLSEMQAFVQPV